MSDQLREAIEWVMLVEQTAQPENLGPHTREQIRLVLAAARRWLAVEEAEPIQWCETHKKGQLGSPCHMGMEHNAHECSIVDARLVVSTEGET